MLIGGLQKFSLIDYPEKLSAVIFTRGCPFRCPFCHNQSLVVPSAFGPLIAEQEVRSFLKSRQGKLDAVVITGGEPTIHKDLPEFIKKIKEMGFLVKLDSCGINPQMLKKLLKSGWLDYIAMDIKAPLKNYARSVEVPVDTQKISKSISLIMKAVIKKEFRSTLVEGLHTEEDVIEMARMIRGAPLYSLQKFIAGNPLNPAFRHKKTFSDIQLSQLQAKVLKHVQSCLIK